MNEPEYFLRCPDFAHHDLLAGLIEELQTILYKDEKVVNPDKEHDSDTLAAVANLMEEYDFAPKKRVIAQKPAGEGHGVE